MVTRLGLKKSIEDDVSVGYQLLLRPLQSVDSKIVWKIWCFTDCSSASPCHKYSNGVSQITAVHLLVTNTQIWCFTDYSSASPCHKYSNGVSSQITAVHLLVTNTQMVFHRLQQCISLTQIFKWSFTDYSSASP